jgi:hypothetical protein
MSNKDTAINLIYVEYLLVALIVRVLDAFGAGSDGPSPRSSPPSNCDAPRFGFGLAIDF